MELIEYFWDENTETSHYWYEDQDGNVSTDMEHHPLQVETPSKEKYWADLLEYIRTQGEP